MAQSLVAIIPEGVINLIGFLSGGQAGDDGNGFGACLKSLCILRGPSVGSRAHQGNERLDSGENHQAGCGRQALQVQTSEAGYCTETLNSSGARKVCHRREACS